MKKNLAKKITLSILAGAMLMSSSVAWAENLALGGEHAIVFESDGSIAVGAYSIVYGDNSIAIGIGAGSGTYTQAGVEDLDVDNAIAIGTNAKVTGYNSVAIGVGSTAKGWDSVALGYGSRVEDDVTNEPVVSVGYGGESGESTNGVPNTRSIINVTDVSETDRIDTDSDGNYKYGSYAVNVNTLNDALSEYYTKDEVDTKIDAISDVGDNSGNYVEKEVIDGGGTETKLSNNFVVTDTTVGNSTTTSVTINSSDPNNPIVMNNEGITVGKNSTRIDGTGVYVWKDGEHTSDNAKAFMNNEGVIKGAGGKFIVDGDTGNVTAQEVTATKIVISDGTDNIDVADELGKKANQSDLEAEINDRQNADTALEQKIADLGGGNSAAIAGLNQRLEKTNAKINKVGAGAAALAALHPLDYDPDDKLTFSAGMGNYAGENAAALGAFYRPNEKFMVSLGGTMGNGENMVNLGLSIGLDKPNGFAKMSKRELIQEVNAVKAENEAMKDQLANADERIAKLEALVAQLVAK